MPEQAQTSCPGVAGKHKTDAMFILILFHFNAFFFLLVFAFFSFRFLREKNMNFVSREVSGKDMEGGERI